jgi:hypothetical protein
VKAELERVGRDPDELVVSMLWAFVGIPGREQLIDVLGEYELAGLDHIVGVPAMHPVDFGALSTHDRLASTLDDLREFAADVLPAVR